MITQYTKVRLLKILVFIYNVLCIRKELDYGLAFSQPIILIVILGDYTLS